MKTPKNMQFVISSIEIAQQQKDQQDECNITWDLQTNYGDGEFTLDTQEPQYVAINEGDITLSGFVDYSISGYIEKNGSDLKIEVEKLAKEYNIPLQNIRWEEEDLATIQSFNG